MTICTISKETGIARKISTFAGIVALSTLLAGCGGGGGDNAQPPGVVTPPASPPVADAGTIQLATPSLLVSEADGTINISVTRTGGALGDVSVDYTISNGSASDSDYTVVSASGTLNWADSQSQANTISISLVDDLLIESTETVNISLSNAANNAVLGSNSSTQISIADNDTIAATTDVLYFYVSEINDINSIYAYDPRNLTLSGGSNLASPSDSILVDDAVQGENLMVSFIVSDTTPGLVSDAHYPAMMYIKGGKIWKVLAQSVSSVTSPIQVSSEANVQLCNDDTFVNENARNFDESLYFYLDAGADGSCASFDDQWKYVKFGWDATVAPVQTMEFLSALTFDANNVMTEYLAWDDASSSLFRCATSCVFVSVFDFAPSIFGSINSSAKEYLLDGNSIVIYDVVANTVSAPVYTSSNLFFIPFEINDGTFSYFSDGGKILRLDAIGNAPVEILDEGAGKQVMLSFFGTTNERLIYSVANVLNNTSEIRSILKTGGASTQLASSAEPGLFITGRGGENIYYSYSQASVPVAGVVQADGSNKTESLNVVWSGFTTASATNIAAGVELFNIFRLDNASRTISVYDAVSFTFKKTSGVLPEDIRSITFLGVDDNARGYGLEQSGFSFDVFYFDVSGAQPLIRVTGTPGVDDGGVLY